MNVEEVSSVAVDTAFHLHRDLGLGLLVVVFVAPIIFWLISMVLALRVFVPVSHYGDIYSHEKALGTYTRILNLKYKRLKYAIMMLVLGFILPVICIIVYQGPVTIIWSP